MKDEIRYTSADGKPVDFELGDKWVREPFDPLEFKPDIRPKLRLIGDVIWNAARVDIAASRAARILHASLLTGEMHASGRFRATTYDDENKEIIVETPLRAMMPKEAFLPFYASKQHSHCTIVFDYEDGGYDNEWSMFDWAGSIIEYWAHGFAADNLMTGTRWICSWSNIMVHEAQALRILTKVEPKFRQYTRPSAVRTAKTDAEILAQAEKMRATGLSTIEIARDMKFQPGFENVQNRVVRDLVRGRWKSGPNTR